MLEQSNHPTEPTFNPEEELNQVSDSGTESTENSGTALPSEQILEEAQTSSNSDSELLDTSIADPSTETKVDSLVSADQTSEVEPDGALNVATSIDANDSSADESQAPGVEPIGVAEDENVSSPILKIEATKIEVELPTEDFPHVAEHELEEMERHENQAKQENYANLNKEQLVQMAEQLNRESDISFAYQAIHQIKPLFDALFQNEKKQALEKFIQDGGDKEAFEFKHSELEKRFNQVFKGINDRKKIDSDTQAKERAANKEKKLILLEELRNLVKDHEHNPNFERFKSIRDEWRKIGPVGIEGQNLHASYVALCEQFSSWSEQFLLLKDIDRKKNLESKLDIISKIEKLKEEPFISKAMKELMTLQEDFRGIGPVAKDKQEELKALYKQAVDAIFERRRAFNEERKQAIAKEIEAKEALVARISELANFHTDQIKEWLEKTKEIVALQEEWKTLPFFAKDKTADLGKQFWAAFKKFMHAKNEFFKGLEKERKEVFAKKQALVSEVESLKDGDDWDGIVNRMKELQAEWKAAAPLYGKEGQKLYDAFKSGIDHFFSRLRDRKQDEDKVQTDNLAKKEAVCVEIESLAQEKKGTIAQLNSFKDTFRNIGFVPSKHVQRINSRFSKALMDLIDQSAEIPDNEKEKLKIGLLSSRNTFSTEGIKTLKNQEGYINKRLQQLRKEAGNLEDNMAMFKMSKNAMALIEDVQKRVNLLRLEIRELEAQLKEIRSAEV